MLYLVTALFFVSALSQEFTLNVTFFFFELSNAIRSNSPTLFSLYVCVIPFIVLYYCFHLVPKAFFITDDHS